MMQVRALRAFSDNYIWLLDGGAGEAFVVDPGDPAPVQAALAASGLQLGGILVTHHHPDHVGGVEALRADWRGVAVYGPEASPAKCITHPLRDGARIRVLGHEAQVLAVPGHTLDHIAYFLPEAGEFPRLFCGDTLFAGGCGRIFEGDARGMHASLSRLAGLPGDTRAYCAHEYTLSNLRFARAVEPDNLDLQEREATDRARRERDEPTVPSTLAMELRTNPFLRCAAQTVRQAAVVRAGRELAMDHEVFGVIRAWKDGFR
jgi:hydroxyacylglutathione hydrolase